jgi:hypothetical protein
VLAILEQERLMLFGLLLVAICVAAVAAFQWWAGPGIPRE